MYNSKDTLECMFSNKIWNVTSPCKKGVATRNKSRHQVSPRFIWDTKTLLHIKPKELLNYFWIPCHFALLRHSFVQYNDNCTLYSLVRGLRLQNTFGYQFPVSPSCCEYIWPQVLDHKNSILTFNYRWIIAHSCFYCLKMNFKIFQWPTY